MQRRALLVLLAGLSGCTGSLPDRGPFGLLGGSGGDPERADSTATPAPESTETPAAETARAGTAAQGATSTPTEAELRTMETAELLGVARRRTEAAVETFIGDGDELTDVRASTRSFDPEPVVEQLYAAQLAYEEADRQGISAAQRETIDRLSRVERALRHTIDAQTQLIQAHVDLTDARRSLANVDSETANSAISRADTRRGRARESAAKMNRTAYEDAVRVLENLSAAAYREKVAQFRAEVEGMAALIEGVTLMGRGVNRLTQALRKDRNGAPYRANELAAESETLLGEGIVAVEDAMTTYRRGAGSLRPLSAAFVTVARERREQARRIHE